MDYPWASKLAICQIWDALLNPGIQKKPVSRLYLIVGVMGRKTGGWGGTLIIRFHVLGETHKRETHFWKLCKLATRTASTIADAFYNAVTEPFGGLEKSDMLTEMEMAQKTEIYLLDEAS